MAATKMLTLRLPEDQAQDLETLARVDGVSVSEEIRNAIAARVEAKRTDREFQERLGRLMDQERAVLERLAR
jgi:post-segregation antitoxin (ccd killing protein)